MFLTQVRSLKAALDTKQGNVSPDTLLALLEAANQEVAIVHYEQLSFGLTLLYLPPYFIEWMEDVVLHSISHNSMFPSQLKKKFDLLKECEALFHNKPIVVQVAFKHFVKAFCKSIL